MGMSRCVGNIKLTIKSIYWQSCGRLASHNIQNTIHGVDHEPVSYFWLKTRCVMTSRSPFIMSSSSTDRSSWYPSMISELHKLIWTTLHDNVALALWFPCEECVVLKLVSRSIFCICFTNWSTRSRIQATVLPAGDMIVTSLFVQATQLSAVLVERTPSCSVGSSPMVRGPFPWWSYFHTYEISLQ